MTRLFQVFTYVHKNLYRTVFLSSIYAVIAAMVVAVLHSVLGIIHWSIPVAPVIIGIIMSCMTWGAERLWYSVLRGTIEPLTFQGFVTRIPFWYVASGIGYSVGMLISKKFGLLGFYDIPIKPVFVFGARIGSVMLLLSQFLLYFVLKKKAQTNSQ